MTCQKVTKLGLSDLSLSPTFRVPAARYRQFLPLRSIGACPGGQLAKTWMSARAFGESTTANREVRQPMRSGLTTLLLLIPILAVPMLAIFGIPNFAPAVASPLGDDDWQTGESAAAGFAPAVGQVAVAPGPTVAQNGLDFSNNPRQSNLERNVPWPGRPRSAAAERSHPSPRLNPGNYEGFDRTASVLAPSAPPQRQPGGQDAAQPPAWPGAPLDGGVQTIGFTQPGEFASPPKYERPASTEVEQLRFESGTHRGSRPPRPLPPAAPSLTWQAAVKRLNELDISNFRLEPGSDPNQFLFVCSYTPPENPQVSYRFEAEASEPIKAVEKVLAQVEARRSRPAETPLP